MHNFQKFTLITLGAASMCTALAAEGIKMEKGMWEMTSTTSAPMFPEPRVATKTECIEKSEFGVSDLIRKQDDQCSITESSVNGNSLSWKMECDMQGGGKGSGGGRFTSNGSSGTGTMHMTMEIQGQTIKMETSWNGKRIGPC